MTRSAIPELLLLLFAICGGSRAQDGEPVDDTALRNAFTRGMLRCLEEGRTVSMEELEQQLDGNRCAVPRAPAPGRALEPAEIYRRARRSVLLVGRLYVCPRCGRRHASIASGFAIGRSGEFVTSYHVVHGEASDTLGAMTADGRVFPVEAVLAADRDADLAVLRLRDADLEPLPLESVAPVGSRVWVLSHPDGQFFTLTGGVVSRYFVLRAAATSEDHPAADEADETSAPVVRVAITADYARGSSGAPVLDERGAVVGIVSSTRSIYHHLENGVPRNLQMVIKQCVPARALVRLTDGGSRSMEF